MNLRVIKVKTPDHVNEYQRLYEREAKLPISADYLSKADSYLIFINGILVAAYTLNDGAKTPLRYLSIFTDEVKAQVLSSPYVIREDSFAEIAAISMTSESSRKNHNLCYTILMWHAFIYAFKHKRKFILGGSIIVKIQRMQFELMPNLLYKAPIDNSLKIVNNARGLVMLYYVNRNVFLIRAIYLLCKKQLSAVFFPKERSTRTQPEPSFS